MIYFCSAGCSMTLTRNMTLSQTAFALEANPPRQRRHGQGIFARTAQKAGAEAWARRLIFFLPGRAGTLACQSERPRDVTGRAFKENWKVTADGLGNCRTNTCQRSEISWSPGVKARLKLPLESITFWVKVPILASCSQSVSICVHPWLNCFFQDKTRKSRLSAVAKFAVSEY